jgi:hypothetical protein
VSWQREGLAEEGPRLGHETLGLRSTTTGEGGGITASPFPRRSQTTVPVSAVSVRGDDGSSGLETTWWDQLTGPSTGLAVKAAPGRAEVGRARRGWQPGSKQAGPTVFPLGRHSVPVCRPTATSYSTSLPAESAHSGPKSLRCYQEIVFSRTLIHRPPHRRPIIDVAEPGSPRA